MIDKQTFVELIEEKHRGLYWVARSILRSDADCEDALQEGILKAWASRHKVKDARFFGTWLTRVVINECRNIQRKRAKGRFAEVATPDFADDLEENVTLRHMLESLPEKLRTPLVLHYMEAYSVKEIAAMLRLSVSTVNNRLYAARQKLRDGYFAERGYGAHEH